MIHLTRVLCAVDTDDRGRQVFEHALALARAHRASLRVLHAASPELPFNRDGETRAAFFDRLRSLAAAVAVELQVVVQRGDVAEIVLLHARAKRPDVIVIGASGRQQRRGVLGGTAERVVRDAPCPTIIVPDGLGMPSATVDTIVCAVDFSQPSLAAAREALRFAGTGRRVVLLHVVDGPTPRQSLYYDWRATDAYYRDLRAVALDKLRFLVPPPLRRDVSVQVIVGEPTQDILIAAHDMRASFLMIGAGGRTRIGSRLFGKTAALLRDAPCPIVAVPAHGSRMRDLEPASERRLAA